MSRNFFVTKQIIVFFCLIGSLSNAYAANPKQTHQENVSVQLLQIDALLNEGKFDLGLELTRKLVGKYGEDPLFGWQLEGRLGLVYLLLGDYAASIPHLQAATQANPRVPAFHRNLATALVKLGRKGRALSEYSEAVALDPDNYEFQLEFAQLLLDYKNFPKARLHLEKANRLCGGCLTVIRVQGHLELASGNPEDAIPLFQSVLQLEPSDSSRRDLVQAMQLAEEDSLVVHFLGNWPMGQLQIDELHLLVNAERRLGESSHAQAFLQQRLGASGVSLPPSIYNRHEFWGEVAYSLLVDGKLDEALRGFELALKIDPGNHAYDNNRKVVIDKLRKQK